MGMYQSRRRGSSHGIVRKLDNLRRIVLPKEFCQHLNIQPLDMMEITLVDGDIIIRSYNHARPTDHLVDGLREALATQPREMQEAAFQKLDELEQILQAE